MGAAREDGVNILAMKFLNFKSLFVVAILLTSISAFSQSKYKNGVFLELAGNGGPYSINYERKIYNSIVGRVGFTYIGDDLLFPISIGKIFGGGSHHFEINLGLTLYHYRVPVQYKNSAQPQLSFDWFNSLYLTSFVGYRYQQPDKRFFYRCGFSPLWRFYNSDAESNTLYQVIPWGGMSVGYRF
jgi:hypothetical protein